MLTDEGAVVISWLIGLQPEDLEDIGVKPLHARTMIQLVHTYQ